MSKLGDYIKQYRETHNNMSIRELAIKCNMSSGYIHKLEKGEDPRTKKPIVPTVDTLNKLACGMNTSINILLELSGISLEGISIPQHTKKEIQEFDKFIENAKAQFMDSSEEDRDIIFKTISDLYWDSKAKNSAKRHSSKKDNS